MGYESDALGTKEQSIATVAAFTANGSIEQLKAALAQALDEGLTISELKEVLVQMYAYAGFPRSLNGLGALMSVVSDREENGIRDERGADASPIPHDRAAVEFGTQVQTELAGSPVTGDLYTFAPTIDHFLKAHLFGDIFGRDVLNFKTREIATIGALASLGGVNPQLAAHYQLGMNTGLTKAQLASLVKVIRERVGQKEGENAGQVLGQFLAGQEERG